jgi:hypothetical protein
MSLWPPGWEDQAGTFARGACPKRAVKPPDETRRFWERTPGCGQACARSRVRAGGRRRPGRLWRRAACRAVSSSAGSAWRRRDGEARASSPQSAPSIHIGVVQGRATTRIPIQDAARPGFLPRGVAPCAVAKKESGPQRRLWRRRALRRLTGCGGKGCSRVGLLPSGSAERRARRVSATLRATRPPIAASLATPYAGLPGVSGWMAACICPSMAESPDTSPARATTRPRRSR